MTRCLGIDGGEAKHMRRQGSCDFSHGFPHHVRSLSRGSSGQFCLGPATPPVLMKTAGSMSRRTSQPKLELACRMVRDPARPESAHTDLLRARLTCVRTQALAENQLPSEERSHRRQNSLSSSLEGLNLDEAFPSENREVVVVPQPEPRSTKAWVSSKTARRRAEYDSKRKGLTFNQRKHQSPSYIRRLERRKGDKSNAGSLDTSFQDSSGWDDASFQSDENRVTMRSPFEACQA